MCLLPFRRAQRGNTVLLGIGLVFPEPKQFIRFVVVVQVWEIWMRKCLPIRLFAFGEKGHKGYYRALSRFCICKGLPSINR